LAKPILVVNFGPVVAGVVGQSKFSFDLWGDTVNVAARLSAIGTTTAIYLVRPEIRFNLLS
jgi:class 3 adenylate cyclase